MRFHWGKIPQEPGFDPVEQGWTPLREPSVWLAQLMALPIGILAVAGLYFCWALAFSYENSDCGFQPSLFAAFFDFSPLAVSFLLIAPLIVHEFIHALVHPGSGRTRNTVLGFWPSKLVFYAHYDGTLSRNRFAFILLTPFVALSLLPLLICVSFRFFSPILFFVSLYNGLCACVDLLGVILILSQLPPNAITRNLGWKTYYRTVDVLPDSGK